MIWSTYLLSSNVFSPIRGDYSTEFIVVEVFSRSQSNSFEAPLFIILRAKFKLLCRAHNSFCDLPYPILQSFPPFTTFCLLICSNHSVLDILSSYCRAYILALLHIWITQVSQLTTSHYPVSFSNIIIERSAFTAASKMHNSFLYPSSSLLGFVIIITTPYYKFVYFFLPEPQLKASQLHKSRDMILFTTYGGTQ